MPSTEYNVDMIMRRVPDESPETIVSAMNELQQIVYAQDSFATEKIESTGMPPYLVTTQGIYEYDCPSDCRRTISILTLSQTGGYSRSRGSVPYSDYYFRGKRCYKVPVETRPATYNSVGKIYFRDDPGTTTTKYFHHYYMKPTEISDIGIQLSLPENVHYLFRDGVIAMFTSDEYGKSNFDEAIVTKIRKKIRAELNKGDGGSLGYTPLRETDQEINNHRGYNR